MKKLTALILLTLLITACNRNSNPTNKGREDPYFQFINAVTIPEPLPQDLQSISSTSIPSKNPVTTIVKLPPVHPLKVPGKDIRIVGSTSLEELNQQIYNQFVKQGFSGQIDIDTIGLSKSVQLFCQQQNINVDIVTTSRVMTDAEKAMCETQGRKLVEFPIGNDALVVVVNRKNTFVKDVTIEQLAAIFSSQRWSDVNPSWPNQPIQHFVSGPISSTLDQLADLIFFGKKDLILKAPNTVVNTYNEPLAQSLSISDYGVGFFTYSFYKKREQAFRPLAINGVIASETTVSDGTYLLPRKLFLYTDVDILKTKPEVSQFINYYLTEINQFLEQENHFPLSQQELDQSKQTWLKTMEIY